MTDKLSALTGKDCVYREGGRVMMGRIQRVVIDADWGALFVIDIIPTEGFHPFRKATTEVGAAWETLSISKQSVHAKYVNFWIIVDEDFIEKIKTLALQGLEDDDFVQEVIRMQIGI